MIVWGLSRATCGKPSLAYHRGVILAHGSEWLPCWDIKGGRCLPANLTSMVTVLGGGLIEEILTQVFFDQLTKTTHSYRSSAIFKTTSGPGYRHIF